MERSTMWMHNLRLVLPDRVIDRGALEIRDGLIASVTDGDAPAADAIDGSGLIAIPGIIDLHGDMIERDIEPRPRARFPVDVAMHELDKRLAATGITTAFAAVAFAWKASDLRTQETAVHIIETLHQMRHTLLTDCRIHARFEVNNPDTVPVLERLLSAGMVELVSIMDHTPGQGQYNDTGRYVTFMKEWLGFSDEELKPMYERIAAKIEVIQTAPRDWSLAERIIRTALAHGVIAASHDDDTLEKIAAQAAMGVTVSEFPINIESARAAREHGMHVIMGAPNAYRGGSNTGNLSAYDAVKAGVVDILATDYVPAAMLHAAWKLWRDGVLPLHEAVRLITANPADAVRLDDRGRLEAGRLADIVFVQDTPVPRVRTTMRAGHVIYSDTHGMRVWRHVPAVHA
jgi:alpha-D-ribose 1-methylphosphonate 5-triphosphate diphosphatase